MLRTAFKKPWQLWWRVCRDTSKSPVVYGRFFRQQSFIEERYDSSHQPSHVMAANGDNNPVEAAPAIPAGFTVLREGEAAILQSGNDVFYNKAQVTSSSLVPNSMSVAERSLV